MGGYFYLTANLETGGPPPVGCTWVLIQNIRRGGVSPPSASRRTRHAVVTSKVNIYWIENTVKLRYTVPYQVIHGTLLFCEFQPRSNWLLFYTHTEQSLIIHHITLTSESRKPASVVTVSKQRASKQTRTEVSSYNPQFGGDVAMWRDSSENLQGRLWRPVLYLHGISATCLILFYSLQTFVDRTRPAYVL
jgi:hypothetical protein